MMNSHHDHRKAYKTVWGLLGVLTVVTVVVAYQNYGVFNIVVAMGIATLKAALVCLYFMHLKYDNRLNQVVFISAFLFLAIFIGLTASDELARPVEALAKVERIEPPAAAQSAKMNQLRLSTPEQVARGKEVFLAQCQSCHGAAGKGDGPAAVALNPKPRDFTSGIWKQGGAPAQVFKTISDGVSGTPMPPFSGLGVEERWGLVHFVRSLSPNRPEDTPETLASIGIQEGKETSPSGPTPTPELPVDFVIERMSEGK